MNERGWVVLMTRGIGLLLVVIWLPSLVATLVTLAYSMQSDGVGSGAWASAPGQLEQYALSLVSTLVAIGSGLYLFLGGEWVIARICRQVVGVCPMCGERVGGDRACPECGYGMAAGSTGRQAASGTSGDGTNADEPT